ncbi:MAG: hypothetical protein WCD79_23375, partial [Chthoniobacteraceae bacterium]
MRKFILVTIVLLLAAPYGWCGSRVAIIADEASQPVADLLMKELSAKEGVSLVERAEISKLGDEAKLQKLVAQDSVATGKLLGADGLIFLRTDSQGVQARFTAVKLGYALFDDTVEAGGNTEQLAKVLAHKVEGYVSKLDLDPAHAIPVSVLNLRADYAAKGSADVERKLTLLLESRLAAVPEYVVLERRHAWDVGFERSVSDVSQPLLKGAFVIDGRLTLPGEAGGEMVVMLRLRAPDGHETSLEIRGAMNDLPGLVEKMSAKIREATGGAEAVQWTPQKEAREYLLEGVWGWQHNSNAVALEALDSAEILGEAAPDLLAVRIPVLCGEVTGSSKPGNNRDLIPDNADPDRQIEAVMRAIDDQNRYQSEKMESRLVILDHFHSFQGRTWVMKEMVARAASALLVMLDRKNNAKAAELRNAIRTFMNYDPLHDRMPSDWDTAIDFADDWSVSMNEETGYYKRLSNTYPWAAYAVWRLGIKLG